MRFHAAFLALLLTSLPAFCGKLSRDLEQAPSQKRVRVNVRYKTAPDEAKHGRFTGRGGRLMRSHDQVKTMTYEIIAGELKSLSTDSYVEMIAEDRVVKRALDYTVETSGASIAAQYGWDGSGVGVAILDSGIRDQKDFAATASGG